MPLRVSVTYGDSILKGHRSSVIDFVRKLYYAYFEVKMGNQDNLWLHVLYAKYVLKTYNCGQK